MRSRDWTKEVENRRYKYYRKWHIRVPDWPYLPGFLQQQQGAEWLVFE
ncbi:MAG: hypothetical protein MR663_04680 [Lachnospiraceae bacterium]|nr:hypothetical protein [Lachnospiraceae bacterium]